MSAHDTFNPAEITARDPSPQAEDAATVIPWQAGPTRYRNQIMSWTAEVTGAGRKWLLCIERGGRHSPVWYGFVDGTRVVADARSADDAKAATGREARAQIAAAVRMQSAPMAALSELRWAALRTTSTTAPGEVLVSGPGAAQDIVGLLNQAFAQGDRADRLAEANAELHIAVLSLERVVRGAIESGWLPGAPHLPPALALIQSERAKITAERTRT